MIETEFETDFFNQNFEIGAELFEQVCINFFEIIANSFNLNDDSITNGDDNTFRSNFTAAQREKMMNMFTTIFRRFHQSNLTSSSRLNFVENMLFDSILNHKK